MAKNDTNTVSAADLGFGSTFDLGSYYFDEDEKNAHIEQRTEFFITGIDYDRKNRFGERYILALEPVDGDHTDTRGWAIAATNKDGVVTNAKRNEVLDTIMIKMSTEDIKKVGPIVFVRRGRTVMFQPAESAANLPPSDPAPERDEDGEDLPF